MKKLIFLAIIIPVIAFGQSTDQNYIKTTTYKYRTTHEMSSPVKDSVNILVTYFDGLGRPIQKVDWKQSSEEKSIYTHIAYDDFGRQDKEYLPYPNKRDLSFDANGKSNTGTFYNSYSEGTSNPFTETFFDHSPINKVMKQASPGNSWAGVEGDDSDHTTKYDYGTNGDDDQVRRFEVKTEWDGRVYNPEFIDMGFYDTNALYKTVTKDENWIAGLKHTTEEFKDKTGRIVLKRTYNQYHLHDPHDERHDTYYVYDNFGNLTYVIPPLADGSSDQLDELCYQYKYDARNRVAEKKLPGKQWEYTIYDKLDRPVMNGPVYSPWGHAESGWMITKYDAFGRVAYTAWILGSDFDRAKIDFQYQFDNLDIFNEDRRGSNVDNIVNIYSSNVIPVSGYKLLTINYYDDYNFPAAPPNLPSVVIDEPVLQHPQGLPTGSWIRALTQDDEVFGETTYTLYDKDSRDLETFSINYLGGMTDIRNDYNFLGQPVYKLTKHKRADSSNDIVISEFFTYTPQDRLLTHSQSVDGENEQLLSHSTYDELGRLITKNVGGEDMVDFTGLQTVDYAYNIRGWLKDINDATKPMGEDLFAFHISYNEPFGDATALYNGNISETLWKSKSDNVLRKYTYQYDQMNRLSNAIYERPELTLPIANSYNEFLTYDKNGNIQSLQRNGEVDDPDAFVQIDDLTYVYAENSNKLMKVSDATNDSAGFKDDKVVDNDDDYGYDAYGNMKSDQNKGIERIRYNHLNQPVWIGFSGTNISYIYDALGQKLKKIVPPLSVMQLGNTETLYLDGFQYVNNKLKFFPHAEGYVNVLDKDDDKLYNYVFNYLDHLGNIRMTYGIDPDGEVLKILEENHYYPFGLKHQNYNTNIKNYNEINELVALRAVNQQNPIFYNYKYNGKEWQDELGLNFYDYGARNYDPTIGRWVNSDPLAEMSRRWSPYNYTYNNPIYFIDPDGMFVRKSVFQMQKDMVCDYSGDDNGGTNKDNNDSNSQANYSADYQGGKEINKKSLGIKDADNRESMIEKILKNMKKGEYLTGKEASFLGDDAKSFISKIIKKGPNSFEIVPKSNLVGMSAFEDGTTFKIVRVTMSPEDGMINVSGFKIDIKGVKPWAQKANVSPVTYTSRNKTYTFHNNNYYEVTRRSIF